jgi:[ribosomal protein S5]-alanine N-acetyltransferase
MLHFQLTPFPTLRTPRLVLRRITAADAPALFEMRSNESVLRYLDREPTKSLEEALALIGKMDENLQKNEGIMWALARPEDEARLLGTCGLWKLDPEHHRGEIGYLLHPSAWGQGLMTEAISAVCRHGFEQLHLHSIEATVNPQNAASIRALERQGFVREAYFRENYYWRGQFLDSAIYSLLAPR